MTTLSQAKILDFKKAKHNGTYGQLMAYHNELLQTQSSIYYKLNQGRINDFYNNNSVRINSIFAKIKELHEKYYEMENGERKIIDVEVSVPEGSPEGIKPQVKKDFVLKEGMTVEKYREEYNELMNQPCNIIF